MTFSRVNLRAVVLLALLSTALLVPARIRAGGRGNESLLPAPSAHVNDFADVIDVETEQRVNNLLESFKQRTGIDFVIAVVKTTGNEDLYDFSLRLTDQWNLGSRTGSQKSMLMVIAADTGGIFTHSSQSALKQLPAGLVGYMGRRMQPQFQEHNYAPGLITGLRGFMDIFGQFMNFTFEALDRQDNRLSPSALAQQTVASSAAITEKSQPTVTAQMKEQSTSRAAEKIQPALPVPDKKAPVSLAVEKLTASTAVEKPVALPAVEKKPTTSPAAEKLVASTALEKKPTASTAVEKPVAVPAVEKKPTTSPAAEKLVAATAVEKKPTTSPAAEKTVASPAVENKPTTSPAAEKLVAATAVEKKSTTSPAVEKTVASAVVEKPVASPSVEKKPTTSLASDKSVAATAAEKKSTASPAVEKPVTAPAVEKKPTTSPAVEKPVASTVLEKRSEQVAKQVPPPPATTAPRMATSLASSRPNNIASVAPKPAQPETAALKPIPAGKPASISPKGAGAPGLLEGEIVDPLGGLIVGAQVTVTDSQGRQKTVVTDGQAKYVVSDLDPGRYLVRATATGFDVYENGAVQIGARRQILNIKLEITIGKQEVTVAAESPLGSSLNMRVLRGKDLAALPTGPGGLAAALRALALPSTGPNGPQILVDGFAGGRLPPKDSIREIRISENPFSSEYPQLGFGRIEILTKPGTEKLQGSAFFNFNDESLNSRNPFALNRAPFQSRLYGGSLSGPIKPKRLSFFADFEHQALENNALINATVLDSAFNITHLAQTVVTPQSRATFSPRFEFQLDKANTIVGRYSYSRGSLKNAGVGDFSLSSRAYNLNSTEQLLQLTETAVLGPNVINELRFQYLRNRRRENGNNSLATVLVPEAFIGGGSQNGLSFNNEDRWEVQNYTSWALRRHNIKAGAQMRGVNLTDFSTADFNGTFTFGGGQAAALDASNNIVRDPSGQPVTVPITSIERYRRTQLIPLFLQRGLSQPEIRALGAGATQFSIAAGEPEARVNQYDLGIFAQDDCQLRPNLSLGLGLRYELQNNINDHRDFAPRLAIAWAPGGDANKRKTVLRAGMGLFYDRFSESYTLAARRFNGISQQRFIVSDPAILDLFPQVPSLDLLSQFAVPQTITRVADNLRAPYTIQSSVSIERELPNGLSLATTFINTRTLKLLRSRNVNAPLPGSTLRPFGNVGNIFEYESSGYFKQNQLSVNLVERLKSVATLWATYVLSNAHSDTDGADTFPANTYDLSTEYGRSVLDVRHSLYLGGWITGPLKLSFSPLVYYRSGAPFNITTGRDTNGDTLYAERPALASDPTRPSVVLTHFGAFDLNPIAGQAIIPRNYGRGPGYFSVNLGVSRAFSFGPESKVTTAEKRASQNSFGRFLSRKYTLTFTIQVENLFNHSNPASPIGNLSSPLFGQSNSSAGAYGFGSNPAGNRRIEIQVYLSF